MAHHYFMCHQESRENADSQIIINHLLSELSQFRDDRMWGEMCVLESMKHGKLPGLSDWSLVFYHASQIVGGPFAFAVAS